MLHIQKKLRLYYHNSNNHLINKLLNFTKKKAL